MKTFVRLLLSPIWFPLWLLLGLLVWVSDSDIEYGAALGEIARDFN